MLDNVLIVITLVFWVMQVIVSCQLSFVVARRLFTITFCYKKTNVHH